MRPTFGILCYSCMVVFALPVYALNKQVECPGHQNVDFCVCHWTPNMVGSYSVVCHDVPSIEDLRVFAHSLPGVRVDSFYVSNSYLKQLAGDTFRGANITRLEIASTPLSDITNGKEKALVGLEQSLKELVMHNCKLTNKVDWSKLQTLKDLRSLDLSFNPLEEILDETFSHPPEQLKELYLRNCQLRLLSLNAFASIKKLVILDLSENNLVQVVRSMFPQPALSLQYLYFSFNQLKELPEDVFSDMLYLKTVYVDYNGLRDLPEAVWRELWENNPRTVDLIGNDIACDKSLCWMAVLDSSFLRGSCSEPDSLRGRRLLTLQPWHIPCDEHIRPKNGNIFYKPIM